MSITNLELKHIGAESHARPLVEDKFFLKLASLDEIHNLADLAFPRRPAHDLARVRNNSKTQDFHFSGFRVYRNLARGNIHDLQHFALMGPDGCRRSVGAGRKRIGPDSLRKRQAIASASDSFLLLLLFIEYLLPGRFSLLAGSRTYDGEYLAVSG